VSDEKATISVVQGTYESCEECGAPLDPQQRYCVNCAARRGNGANPSSRYFAAMSKKARRPLTRPPAKSGPGSRAAAVAFFALLPVAVALGVVVGRGDSGGGDNEALLQALRQQEAATATASTAGPTAAATNLKAKKAGKASKAPAKGEGKVVAKTKNGTVHSVTDFKASEEKTQEDTQIVSENPEQTGDNYIKAQQNLPDVTVIGGEPGSAPAPSSGVEP
jgi:hypothetical protein